MKRKQQNKRHNQKKHPTTYANSKWGNTTTKRVAHHFHLDVSGKRGIK